MRKRRKVIVILGLIAVAAVGFVLLRPRDEPKYEGRYLSEWMATYEAATYGLDSSSPTTLAELEEAKHAVRAIGTNALPCFIKWMKHSELEARIALVRKLPSWIGGNQMVGTWYVRPAIRRLYGACDGIRILGTNAAVVIPELNAMMCDQAKSMTARKAISALAAIGEPAIPVLKAALADSNRTDRWQIVWSFHDMARDGYTNACLPLMIEALNDKDYKVRDAATNSLTSLAPQLLTNTPSQHPSAPPQ